MKKYLYLFIIITTLGLSSCKPEEAGVDCELFPDHETCVTRCPSGTSLIDGECVLDENTTVGTLLNEVANGLGTLTYTGEDLNLVTSSINNSTISWVSSDATIISNSGEVFQYPDDKEVILTATITINGVSIEKSFNLTIPALTNISTVSDAKALPNDSTVNVYGVVVGMDQDGYFIYDNTQSIYVNSSTQVTLGETLIVTGMKQFSTFPYINEVTIKHYNIDVIDFPEVSPHLIAFYLGLSSSDNSAFGSFVNVEGVLSIIDGDYFLVSGSDQIKISNEVNVNIQTFLSDNLYKKVHVTGVLKSYTNEVWDISVASLDYVTFRDLTNSDKLSEISKWIKAEFPSIITNETQIQLPSTNEIYGGTITWGFSNSKGLIDIDGNISRPFNDTDISLDYSISLDQDIITGELFLTIPSSVMTISELINEEMYAEAKANWNASGNYLFAGTYNIEGRVIFHHFSSLVLMDDVTKDVVTIEGLSSASLNNLKIGDYVKFSNVTLKTLNFRLYFYDGDLEETIPKEIGWTPTYEYQTYTYDEFISLDPKEFSTYNQLVEIEHIYTCRDTSAIQYIYSGTPISDCSYASITSNQFTLKSESDKFYNFEDKRYTDVRGIYINFYGYVIGKNVVNNHLVVSPTDNPTFPEVTHEEVALLIQAYLDQFLLGDWNYITFQKHISYDSSSAHVTFFPTGQDALLTQFVFTCNPSSYCVDGALPIVKDEANNDITPGHAYQSDYDTSIAAIVVHAPEGGEAFEVSLTVSYTVLDSQGNLTDFVITKTITKVITVGKDTTER